MWFRWCSYVVLIPVSPWMIYLYRRASLWRPQPSFIRLYDHILEIAVPWLRPSLLCETSLSTSPASPSSVCPERSGEQPIPSVHFLRLLAPSLELSKAESESPSKLSLPRQATSITEAERLWVRIKTALNLYTLHSTPPSICSQPLSCVFSRR